MELCRQIQFDSPDEVMFIEGTVAKTRRAGWKDDAVEEDADQ